MGDIDNCPGCIPNYGEMVIIILFTIVYVVYVVFRIILICYIRNDDILDNYTDTSTGSSTDSGNDIMLPKYTHFDELTEDEIQYTLPPVYNENDTGSTDDTDC